MNKKGFIFWIIIAAVVILVGILAFISSANLRYTIIGGGIITGSFFLAYGMMRSSVTLNKVIIVTLVVLVGVFIILMPKIGLVKQAGFDAVCTGGQVLAKSDVSLSSSAELDKEVVRVLFSTMQTGECLTINVGKSELQGNFDEEEFLVTDPIMGEIWLTKKMKEYNLFEDNTETFFKFATERFDASGIITICSDNKCNERFGSIYNSNNLVASANVEDPYCVCVYDVNAGVGGDFMSSEGLIWEAKVQIGDETPLILNQSKLSGTIGDIAFVKWAGNIQSNDNLGSIDADAYMPFSNNQFRFIETGTYNELDNDYWDLRNALDICDTGGLNECIDEIADINSYNSEFDFKTRDDQEFDWRDRETLVQDASIYDNKLSVTLNSEIAYRIFTLDIAAEEVGIYLTGGEPEVQCLNDFNMDSGDLEEQTLRIKNIADENSSFFYQVNCDTGSLVLQPSPPTAINSGGTLDITGSFGLTVEEGTETASCEFEAYDINTLKSDSCSFSFESTKTEQCTNGDTSCKRSELWTCLDDGSYDKLTCDLGCLTIAKGEARCKLSQNETSETSELTTDKQNCLAQNSEEGNRYVWTTTVEEDAGVLGWRKWTPFVEPKKVTSGYCSDTWLPYIGVGIFAVVAVIIVGGIIGLKLRSKKKKK